MRAVLLRRISTQKVHTPQYALPHLFCKPIDKSKNPNCTTNLPLTMKLAVVTIL